MLTPYDIETYSSGGMQSEEEAEDWVRQIEELQDRVCKIEEKIGKGARGQYQKLCVLSAKDLYEARIDYSNDTTKQWSELKTLLRLGLREVRQHTSNPITVSERIFVENESRLMYKGYMCEPIPFTHCTRISYVGELKFTMHLDNVD